MASLVLGLAGAAVGSTFGSAFAAMGFAAGAAIGSALFTDPIKVQGPRLGDLKVQKSQYGLPIPIIYGTSRVAGNVIWATDIREKKHKESSGGKGGGPSTETTSFTYSQSFAVALCEGPIYGISRIWANDKLIYNVSGSADAVTFSVSYTRSGGMRVYLGSETQTADSLIEADVGAANCPAFRGIAYILFEGLQLADFGNRMPNFEFEVAKYGSVLYPAGTVTTKYDEFIPAGSGYLFGYDALIDPLTGSYWVILQRSGAGTGGLAQRDLTSGRVIVINIPPALGTGNNEPQQMAYNPVDQCIYVSWYGSAGIITRTNVLTHATTAITAIAISGGGATPFGVAIDTLTNSVWVSNHYSFAGPSVVRILLANPSHDQMYWGGGVTGSYCGFETVSNSVWVTLYPSGIIRINVVTHKYTLFSGKSGSFMAFDPEHNEMWFGGNAIVNVLTEQWWTLAALSGGAICYIPELKSMACTSASGGFNLINCANRTSVAYMSGYPSLANIAYDPIRRQIIATRYGSDTVYYISIDDRGIIPSTVTLASVVSDICRRSGLTAGQIDVTGL